MIIIIDIGKPGGDPFSYTRFTKDATHVVLDGTFQVIGRFEVLEETGGLPSVIQDVATDPGSGEYKSAKDPRGTVGANQVGAFLELGGTDFEVEEE